MLPESRSFYIRGEDGEEYGPADLSELREWVRENRAGIGTEVRRDEPHGTWNDWQTYPELVALVAEVHVTSPVPGQPTLIIAPMGRRVAAFGIDLMLVMALWTPIMFIVVMVYMPDLCQRFVEYFNATVAAAMANPPGTPPSFEVPQSEEMKLSLVFHSVLLLYMAGFNLAHGQTPAKGMLRMRVVDQFGRKPGPIKILLRALLLIFSINLFFIPLAYAFFNPQRRAFHDFIVGTYVVEA